MRQYNQQNTPFSQNISDLWDAMRNRPRIDGRGWLNAVTHEALNVLVEAVRAHPKIAVFIVLVLITIGLEWWWTGTFL